MNEFTGVKIALLKTDEVLVIQRDDKPGLQFAGMWDLPGGAREGEESPFECVAREVDEELGITINASDLIWEATHPSINDPEKTAFFMVAAIHDADLQNIVFGNEGQGWKMMKIDEFMRDETVVEPMKGRLQKYLDSQV